jgi:WD40 repeat protein
MTKLYTGILFGALWGLSAAAQELPKGATAQIGTSSPEWNDAVQTLACSPDGKTIVLGRRKGNVEQWDLETRRLLRTLLDPEKDKGEEFFSDSRHIQAVSFSRDGKQVAAVGFGFGTRLWDASTGDLIWRHREGQSALAISPDGKTLIAVKGFEGDMDVWDLAEKKCLATITGHKQQVNSLAFSIDGKSIYSCSTDLTVRKWGLATRKELWRLGEESAKSAIGPTFPQHLILSDDGSRLAVSYHGCWYLKLALVDPETGKQLWEMPVQHSDAIVFMPKENTLAVQSERLILLDAAGVKPKARSPEMVSDRIFGMAFTPDGRRLITTKEAKLLVWDLSQFEPVRD